MSGVPTSSLMSSGIGIYKVGLTTKKMQRNIYETCLNSLNSFLVSHFKKWKNSCQYRSSFMLLIGKNFVCTLLVNLYYILLLLLQETSCWYQKSGSWGFSVFCLHEEAGFSKQPFFSVKWLFCLENTALMLQFLCSSK